MNRSIYQLFDVVQHTLKNTPYDQAIYDEPSFCKLAHENGLSGMIFSTLSKQSLSKPCYDLFKKDFYAYHANDIKQLELIEKLKDIFNEAKIKHVFLKGVHLKKVYPASYMRAMYDIDLLIDEAKFKFVKPLLHKNGFKLKVTSEAHDNYQHESGVIIEVHPKLTTTFNQTQEKFFDKAWDYANQDNHYTYTFNYAFELVYLLHHMAKHFYGSGVGLRSILDIGLYIETYKDSIKLDKLSLYLKQTEYTKFFQTILYLNNEYFKLNPLPLVLKDYQLDKVYYDRLTNTIITSGIHGTGANNNQFIGRVASHKLRNETRFTLLRRIIFPSYKTMIGSYPCLRKLPFLLPIAYILRLFKLSILQAKMSFRKLKQLSRSHDDADQTAKLYKEIGL